MRTRAQEKCGWKSVYGVYVYGEKARNDGKSKWVR